MKRDELMKEFISLDSNLRYISELEGIDFDPEKYEEEFNRLDELRLILFPETYGES